MGFFSELLGAALPIVGGIFGGATGAGAGTAIANILGAGDPEPATALAVGTGAQLAAMRGVSPLLGTNVAQSLAAIGTGTTVATVGAIVTGRLRKQTTVQTIDPATGRVVRSVTFAGGVAVRAADAAAAKRFFRQIRKLDAKLPRRTVKESAVKQLTDRVVKNALEKAGDNGPSCPPKC